MAIASMLLGILGLGAWVYPLGGYPVVVIGLVLGVVEFWQPGKTNQMAIAGMVMCSIGLLAIIVTDYLGLLLFPPIQ